MLFKIRNRPLQLLFFLSIFALLFAGQLASKAYAGDTTIKVGFIPEFR